MDLRDSMMLKVGPRIDVRLRDGPGMEDGLLSI